MKQGDPKVLKLERQLNLVSFLLSARAPVPFSEIRGKVVGYDDDASADAVEKRFDRDKADLRSIGVDIEYVSGDVFGRAGYVIDPQGYYLRETTLEPEDAMLLAVLQRTMGVVDDSLGRNLKSALAKLTIDSRLPEPLRASMGEQHLLTSGQARCGIRRAATSSCSARRWGAGGASSSATRSPGETGATKRVVHPYGLGVADGDWHVVGLRRGARGRPRLPRRPHPRQGDARRQEGRGVRRARGLRRRRRHRRRGVPDPAGATRSRSRSSSTRWRRG